MPLFTKVQSGNFPSAYPTAEPISATGSYAATTTAGNLLVCIISLTQDIDDSVSPVPPTIAPPSTPGFTWTLAAEMTSDLQDDTGISQYLQNAVAIYYIANAPSMASSVVTTCTTNLYGDGVYADNELGFDLTEWNGPGAVDSTATAKGLGGA